MRHHGTPASTDKEPPAAIALHRHAEAGDALVRCVNGDAPTPSPPTSRTAAETDP